MSIGAIGRAALGAVAIGKRLVADAATDAYDILRAVSTDDGEGGSTAVESVAESGRCILTAGATRPEERAIADQQGSTVPYVVRALRWDSVITAQDVVRINGRRFEVLGVLRPESMRAAITAICEERS